MTDPDVHTFQFLHRCGLYRQTTIKSGYLGHDRIVPPAGEEHAFMVPTWRHEVDVTTSPTGRSVHVFVDGVKVYP